MGRFFSAKSHAGTGPFHIRGKVRPCGESHPSSVKPTVISPSAGQTDPLAEWYLVGHRMGQEAVRAVEDFGGELPQSPTEGLSQMMMGLGVDVYAINTQALPLCIEGYRDGIAHKGARFDVPPGQSTSILPNELRGSVTNLSNGKVLR